MLPPSIRANLPELVAAILKEDYFLVGIYLRCLGIVFLPSQVFPANLKLLSVSLEWSFLLAYVPVLKFLFFDVDP